MPRISLSVCFLSLALAFSSLAQAQALQSMKAHEKLGVTCQQCHGINTPTTAPNEKQCLSCHANSSGHYRGACHAILILLQNSSND